MLLSELRPGQKARVTDLIEPDQTQSPSSMADVLGRRLMELGFIPGTIVAAMHEAPLTHDPRSYMVRGMHVALRSYEANRIKIESIGQEVVAQ